VLAWNTRYTTAALDHLAGAHPELVADDAALARLAPVGHAHINPLGGNRFDDPHAPPSGGGDAAEPGGGCVRTT